jgi:hypothetical protein
MASSDLKIKNINIYDILKYFIYFLFRILCRLISLSIYFIAGGRAITSAKLMSSPIQAS